ncbi:MAG: deoxyribodipyrimidine photo-lyase [Candidatus Thorarchaeota archaeon]
MIHQERVKHLNQNEIQPGRFVLYWMQSSQRTEYNHALEYSIQTANKLGCPLLVYFGLTPSYPEANERSYMFMFQGLIEVEKYLKERGIPLLVRAEEPYQGAKELSRDSVLIVVDRDYQKMQREWRERVSASVRCPVIQVETNVVVPIEVASGKEEYSAATLRPKIGKNLERFLTPIPENQIENYSRGWEFDSIDLTNPTKLVETIGIDRSVGPAPDFHGGTNKARQLLDDFIKKKLDEFHKSRNDPSKDCLSNLSPYLHFGQISPLFIALQVHRNDHLGVESFLEELIVRRELSMNFVYFNQYYDSIDCLPAWARTTLEEHSSDPREYLYSLQEYESAETHDSYWNAAQTEMVRTGKMHGYMRMYWGKKILEWSHTPEMAYEIALYLNNKYELDGRDPNGYAGVAWCFGKHDRAWGERPIFGKVRYMSARGLERKFDIEEYVRKIGL